MQLIYTLYTPYTCASQGGSCGESEISVMTTSGSTSTVWQFVVSLVLLYIYPHDGRNSGWNTLVINSVTKYIICMCICYVNSHTPSAQGYGTYRTHTAQLVGVQKGTWHILTVVFLGVAIITNRTTRSMEHHVTRNFLSASGLTNHSPGRWYWALEERRNDHREFPILHNEIFFF